MDKMIIDLLNTLGLGINGIMPSSNENWVCKLKIYIPSFNAKCVKRTDTSREFDLMCGSTRIRLTYTISGKRIVGLEVS